MDLKCKKKIKKYPLLNSGQNSASFFDNLIFESYLQLSVPSHFGVSFWNPFSAVLQVIRLCMTGGKRRVQILLTARSLSGLSLHTKDEKGSYHELFRTGNF